VLLEEKDGRFRSVTPGLPAPPSGATTLEGLTLPGLANAHSHAFHRALRGRTHEGRGSFWSWRTLMYEVADRLDPDSYGRLARATFAEMALAGFTAVGEFHYLHHQPGGQPYDDPNQMGATLVEAARAAGIRITLLDTCYLTGGFDAPLVGPQLRFGDGDAAGWIERVQTLEGNDGCVIGAAIHSVRAVPPVAAAAVAQYTAERKQSLHAHVAEQVKEGTDCQIHLGTTPLGALDRAGAVGPRFTAVHGTHLTELDVARLGRAGGGCCACPTTERDLGDGIGPFAALVKAGVPLCIGTDSHAVIDGFEETRAIELDARLDAEQRGVLSVATLLEAATAGGMTALGWEAGRLAPGYLADFVTVRLDSRRTAGADPDLAASAVFSASAADVDTVVVGGRTVVEGGQHLLVRDVAGELARAIEAVTS
jgi:formiminoglutamate deiminase